MIRKRFLSCLPFIVCFLILVTGNQLSAQQELSSGTKYRIPASWPSSQGVSPQIQGWTNAIRVWGSDRYETSLATSLTLRGNGGFPFETPDNSSAGSKILSESDGWWGVGSCPSAVIIVAGDSPADALSASALSDPTGNSSEPYLRRVAAADPLFNPIGGFMRVDTNQAPILVTKSSRSGGFALSTPTRLAALDMRMGGCKSARDAILVGGMDAISENIEVELLSIGYEEIFRVAGVNRYATAAAVLSALGTSAAPPEQRVCVDSSSADGDSRMVFYANSVVEWRSSISECVLLERTVVLTDGITGADALSASWWTSFWQVPVLLHNGGDRLPAETAMAMQTTEIENIIILGGTKRISEKVAKEASALTSAPALRVGGSNRFETSVMMAKHFGGWWPTGKALDYENAMLCLVGSFGYGNKGIGWPDALGAGPWCAAASGAAMNPGAPGRLLRSIAGDNPSVVPANVKSKRDAIPVILVEAGETELPASVTNFLASIFPSDDVWCSSSFQSGGCAFPGFVVGFGGAEVISEEVMERVSKIVGGRLYLEEVQQPLLQDPFLTALSMRPVYRETSNDAFKFCVGRGGYLNARWLLAGVDNRTQPSSVVDVFQGRWYLSDNDQQVRNSQIGAPGCLGVFPSAGTETFWMRAAGGSGLASEDIKYGYSSDKRITMNGLLTGLNGRLVRGIDTSITVTEPGDETELSYSGSGSPTLITVISDSYDIANWDLAITLKRAPGAVVNSPTTFVASFRLNTTNGTISGSARGEATQSGVNWFLRGRSEIEPNFATGIKSVGGFSLDINSGLPGVEDDRILWAVDAFN